MKTNARFSGTARLLAVVGFASALAGLAGCGEIDSDEAAATAATQGALDNSAVPDGTACYQDVPMRKGSMSYGVCCFDDPVKGTSECIICDAAHHCTPGGATPGCLTGLCNAALGSIKGAVTAGGSVTSPVVGAVSRSAAFAR